MSTAVTINDVIPRTQSIATNLQTVFDTNWTADVAANVNVYARATGVGADDATQLVSSANYNVTFIGGTETVRVTFLVGRTTDDIVTIVRNTPADRLNLYTNTNFTPSMLNDDTGILTLVDQQSQLFDEDLAPHYNKSCTFTDESDKKIDNILPILGANQIWAKNNANDEIIVYDVPSSGGVAPKTATYLIQTSAGAELPNAQIMGSLASGIVVNTLTTGVQLTRVLTGTTDQITVGNGSGISGAPTFSISDNPILPGTGSFIPPKGTTAQRPGSPVAGMVRYNTNFNSLEVYQTSWDLLSGGLVDTITGTANQITINNTDPANPIIAIAATYVGQTSITTLGTIGTGVWEGTDVGILYGGTGVSAVTTAPTASAWSGWDANSNASASAFIEGFATTASAGATTTLTVASEQIQELTGVLTQTYQMPVTSTLVAGMRWMIINNSSGVATINSSGGNLILSMAANTTAWITCVLNSGTTAASWNSSYVFDLGAGVISITGTADQVIASASTGAITLSLPQSIASTSSPTFAGLTLTNPLTVANGGSGRATTTAYAVICGGTTSTGAEQSIASVGTSGQVLTSNGAGALPTFQAGGGLKSFQVFTSGTAATYTRPAGITSILVELWGGGGGGGGVAATASSTSSAGGGGAGGYARLYVAASASSYTYTVGGGGGGGAAGANNGTSGTTTTFSASSLQATGGVGGEGTSGVLNTSAQYKLGGAGGVGTNGNVNANGAVGGAGAAIFGAALSGYGANSPIGGGGNSLNAAGTGNNATVYASGGGGAVTGVATNRAGGNGSAGLIIVWEFA